ncbi:SagB/ThcOx family dehydrogenase [Caldibacillus thermoamylovorans]|uniref:SagB/ThcOx family dehydrogenase n=1 Tax=Caldibacillus thermoamylovorans TaxID=35841 RepID=UPI0022E95A18|nr:SagB/ThcOx family dehydrogenase [Caldibacillus thermoamylovorans]
MNKEIKLSDNLIFFWKEGHFVCDNYLLHDQKSINPKLIPLLNWFSMWKEKDSISDFVEMFSDFTEDMLSSAIEQLIEAKILITEDSEEYTNELSLGIWGDWGNSAKYFHYNTRLLSKDKYLLKDQDFKRLKEKKDKNYNPPNVYKLYSKTERLKLPQPIYKKENSFINTLLDRQTVRSFKENHQISIDELSTILYYVWGVTSCKLDVGIGKALFKTTPSGGARHPIEVYPCIFNVEGVEPGIYHYSTLNHELELLKKGDFRELAVEMAAGQDYVGNPSVTFFYTACIERSLWKYESPRTYRIIMMDLGHLSQTFYLVASWLGLGAFFTGHLKDELVEKELNLDKSKEIVLGVSGLGVISEEVQQLGRNQRFLGELQELKEKKRDFYVEK